MKKIFVAAAIACVSFAGFASLTSGKTVVQSRHAQIEAAVDAAVK